MDNLDALLRDAAVPVAVPDGLMARILADAQREQPVPNPFGMRAAVPAKFSLWDKIADMFGGGGVIAGLASVACAGLYLGAAQPNMISALPLSWNSAAAVDQLDYMPSIDALLVEE